MDTLHVRLPVAVPHRKDFSALYYELACQDKTPMRETKDYLAVTDLRPYGFSSILHHGLKHGKRGTSKLELVNVGKMGYAHVINEIERVVDCRPESLDLMRLDLCADVPDVPVEYFWQRTRVAFKRWNASIGQFSLMGNSQMQTIYFGKRPNCVRIYDKTAELRAQYQTFKRDFIRDAAAVVRTTQFPAPNCGIETVAHPGGAWDLSDEEIAQLDREYHQMKSTAARSVPAFENVFGVRDDAVLTRTERQMGGGRIPLKIGSVGRLQKYLPEFNPFEKLVIEHGAEGAVDENIYFAQAGARVDTYALGIFLRERAKTYGQTWARKWLDRYCGRNAKRTWERVQQFMPAGAGVTSTQLFEVYQQSVRRQLAA